MKVLITGVTGMAGSHLAEYCLKQGAEVHGTKRWRADMSNILEENYYKINFHECDLRDQSSVTDVIGSVKPDKIFHTAAQSFVKASWQYPHETFYTNIMGQCNIFEAVRQLKLDPVIQICCSSEEYGMVPPEEAPIKETNPLRPLSPYGVSKVAQDLMGWQYFKSYGLRIIRTRAFNHEGPRRGHAFVTSNFALQVARIEAGLVPAVIYVGNLTSKRDYTDVRDMVRAYWLATEKCTPGEVYNICTGKTYPTQFVLDYLLSQSKVPIKVEVDPARLRPSDVQLLLGDSTKFREATGWEPEISIEKTLSDTLDFWRDRVKNGVLLRNS
jgi:GDP-4-dehydro-6-deoxy-D-mannose reductase